MQLKEQAAAAEATVQPAAAQADLAGPRGARLGQRAPPAIERITDRSPSCAINLAAWTSLAQADRAQGGLDRQAADLTEAMTTLEAAIRQIDRESRELLLQTFRGGQRACSPSLFGGGQAKLVLTSEEILDSGVAVVAQPPGKRNTSIHLLSGGEKAPTAISLVSALFQLNPRRSACWTRSTRRSTTT